MKKNYLTYFLVLPFLFLSCSEEDGEVLAPFNNFAVAGMPQLSKDSEFIIIIPDTQLYTVYEHNRGALGRLVERILEIDELGYPVKAVLQVGDLTEKNSAEEWNSVKQHFSKLDGKINYMLATGNHDYGEGGTGNNRQTQFPWYIDYSQNDYYIGSFEENKTENSYFQFEVQEQKFQLFSLEFAPRDEVVKWASSLAGQHPKRKGILLTHAYLSKGRGRYNFEEFGMNQPVTPYSWALNFEDIGSPGINDGEQLWTKLVHPDNFRFVFSGHINSGEYLLSKNALEEEVMQMVFAEHNLPQAVEGWIRILEFHDDQKTLTVRTYSTIFNEWKTDEENEFEFVYNP